MKMTDLVYPKDNLPNGWHRFAPVTIEDGVPHVWHEGQRIPNFTDHYLTVELSHNLWSHDYLDDYYGIRKEKRSYGYENSPQEALDSIIRIQDELAKEGEYVPIYIRY
jgi:hypothetical protein